MIRENDKTIFALMPLVIINYEIKNITKLIDEQYKR